MMVRHTFLIFMSMSGLIFGADYQLEALLSAAQEEYDCVRSSESVQTYENSTASGVSNDQDCDQLPSCAELASVSLKKVVDIENIDGQVSTPVSYLSFDAFMHQLSEDKKRKRSAALEQSGNSNASDLVSVLSLRLRENTLPYKRQRSDHIYIRPVSTTVKIPSRIFNKGNMIGCSYVTEGPIEEFSEARLSLNGVDCNDVYQACLALIVDPRLESLRSEAITERAMASVLECSVNSPVLVAQYGRALEQWVKDSKARGVVQCPAKRVVYRRMVRAYNKYERCINQYVNEFRKREISEQDLVGLCKDYFSEHSIAAAFNVLID